MGMTKKKILIFWEIPKLIVIVKNVKHVWVLKTNDNSIRLNYLDHRDFGGIL